MRTIEHVWLNSGGNAHVANMLFGKEKVVFAFDSIWQRSAADQLAEQCATFCLNADISYISGAQKMMRPSSSLCRQVTAAKLLQLLDTLML